MRTVPGPGADRWTRETGGGLVIQNGWATVSFATYFSKIIIIHYFTESPLPTAILSSRHSKRTLPNLPMSSILVIFLFGDLDIMTYYCRLQRTPPRPPWSCSAPTTWSPASTAPRRPVSWRGAATMARSATGTTGQTQHICQLNSFKIYTRRKLSCWKCKHSTHQAGV